MTRAAFSSLYLPILLLAGCYGGAGDSGAAADIAGLTGRFEAGDGERRNQLCLIERDGGSGSFGLISWGRGDANCSGSGTVRREGDRLRLLLDGDEACAIEARVEGERITIANGLSNECSRYYCGPGAELGGAFARVGEGEAEARLPTDLAGDPLCAQ